MPTPNTAEHAAAEKKDCPTLTSRTLAPPNTSSKAQTGARARDAKSMPKATGRWTTEEHDEFLKCLDIYGREWKKVAERITTRTAAQIRSHAQKYFKKIEAAGEGAPKAAKPATTPAAADGAPQIPAETLAGALGALDDMLRALRSKRARYDDDQTPSEAASDASDAPPVEKRPRAARSRACCRFRGGAIGAAAHVTSCALRQRAGKSARIPPQCTHRCRVLYTSPV